MSCTCRQSKCVLNRALKLDTTLTGCKSKPGHSRPFSMTYSFEGQPAADNDIKFAINMSPTLLKTAIFPKFLHFNAERGKSIVVLDKKSVPAKNCQELYCAVHELPGE